MIAPTRISEINAGEIATEPIVQCVRVYNSRINEDGSDWKTSNIKEAIALLKSMYPVVNPITGEAIDPEVSFENGVLTVDFWKSDRLLAKPTRPPQLFLPDSESVEWIGDFAVHGNEDDDEIAVEAHIDASYEGIGECLKIESFSLSPVVYQGDRVLYRIKPVES